MKLKETIVIHKNKDDYMMVDASGTFSGLIHSNATAAFIAKCLQTDTTKEKIIEKMLDKYDVCPQEAAESVDKVITILKRVGAIDE